MPDLQVAYLQDVMPVRRIDPLDIAVPSIRVVGQDMNTASTVLINGLESPAFVVVSQSEIISEIPSSVVGDLIRSVAVLSNRIGSSDRSVLVFRLGGNSSKVSGILRLVQRFVLMLLTTPGTDLLNPELGGGLLNIIGRQVQGSQQGGINTAVQQSISKAAGDLRTIQAKASANLLASERLTSATLAGVQFDARTTTLAIRVIVESSAGKAALANLFV